MPVWSAVPVGGSAMPAWSAVLLGGLFGVAVPAVVCNANGGDLAIDVGLCGFYDLHSLGSTSGILWVRCRGPCWVCWQKCGDGGSIIIPLINSLTLMLSAFHLAPGPQA